MAVGTIILVLALHAGAEETSKVTRQARLNQLHLAQAGQHKFEADSKTALKLQEKPIYLWTNPTRNNVQEGAVYVWMKDDRPEVIATVFSHPERGSTSVRSVTHEFHSLSRKVFDHSHPAQRWKPRAGIETKPVEGAPSVPKSSTRRKLQVKALARDFTAHSMSLNQDNRIQLRMLPSPIMTYQPKDDKVLEGSLFVLAAGVGTDPEVILMIEAVKHEDAYRWEYAVCRYSDQNLYVQHKKKEIWSSVRGGANQFMNDPKHLYQLMFMGQAPWTEEI